MNDDIMDWWCVAPYGHNLPKPRRSSPSECTWLAMDGHTAKQFHENCGTRNVLGQIRRPKWVKEPALTHSRAEWERAEKERQLEGNE